MNFKIVAGSGLAMLLLAACNSGSSSSYSGPAVGSSSDLSAFQGAPAGQAEMGIQSLGFEIVRNEGLTNYWFNRETGACAAITTGNGRYETVVMLPSGDC